MGRIDFHLILLTFFGYLVTTAINELLLGQILLLVALMLLFYDHAPVDLKCAGLHDVDIF